MQTRAPWIVVLALALPASVAAQSVQNIVLRNSFNPVGAGARGLGMGGAFIAVADDGTAASFNPAGLAQLRRSEIALVGFTSALESELRLGPTLSADNQRHSAPDFFGVAVPFDAGGRNLTVQLSYQRAVDLFGGGRAAFGELVQLEDLGFPLSGQGIVNADVQPSQSGAFHTGSLSAGFQATSRLSLGASANVWVADWTADGDVGFAVTTVPRAGRPAVELLRSERRFRQEQSMRGVNFSAGLQLKYPRFSLGAVVRAPFSGDYDLDETGREVLSIAGQPTTERPIRYEARTRLRWPLSAGAGVAVRPFNGLTLAFDYTQSQWSRTSIEDVPAGALLTPAADSGAAAFTSRNFFDLRAAPLTGTANTHQMRAGGEYLVVLPRVIVPLRGGWFEDRSPVVDLGDEGRRIRGWTAGTGLNFNRLVLDVAYERRTSSGGIRLVAGANVQRGSDPTGEVPDVPQEDVQETRVVASLIWRFGGSDDALKNLFRAIFVGPREAEDGAP